MSFAIGSGTPVIERAEWGARDPSAGYRDITGTAQGNTGHYEGPQMGDYSHDSCPAKVRGIQAYHMDSNGWSDVAYNTLTCRHGVVFLGRGYGVRSAANGTNDSNSRSYAHCVIIGAGDDFPDPARQALHDVFAWFEEQGSGSDKWGHQDWFNTACPGDPVLEFIRGGLVVAGPPPSPLPAPPSPFHMQRLLGLLPRWRGESSRHWSARWINGMDVARYQIIMRDGCGQAIDADGWFGPATAGGVLNVQRFCGLTVDGWIGDETGGLLEFIAATHGITF